MNYLYLIFTLNGFTITGEKALKKCGVLFRIYLFLLIGLLWSCTDFKDKNNSAIYTQSYDELRAIASKEGFNPYSENPVVTMGAEGSWDAGALGSMSVLKVRDTFHVYYEAWGVRSDAEWDASEYESLQIGHAYSTDGVNWTKDLNNPVLPKGGEADFDRTGVWDPYVIFEDGLYKMWYGGGGGSQPNFGWAFATSKDGSTWKKKGLIGIGNQTGCEDVHVVKDPESGLYYMYYWYGWDEPEGLKLVTSTTETGFDFNERINITIKGDDSYMKKFGHVLRDENGWHMFYSNFVQPHCPNSITRYAYSEDGIHWEAKNTNLLLGHDSEVLKVADDLYLMLYSPQNHFDKKDCDIRLAVYEGTLADLANKPPYVDVPDPTEIVGKSFEITLDPQNPPITFTFKPEGEVILSEESNEEDPYTFNAYYIHQGDSVGIYGENLYLTGTYDDNGLILSSINK